MESQEVCPQQASAEKRARVYDTMARANANQLSAKCTALSKKRSLVGGSKTVDCPPLGTYGNQWSAVQEQYLQHVPAATCYEMACFTKRSKILPSCIHEDRLRT